MRCHNGPLGYKQPHSVPTVLLALQAGGWELLPPQWLRRDHGDTEHTVPVAPFLLMPDPVPVTHVACNTHPKSLLMWVTLRDVMSVGQGWSVRIPLVQETTRD